MNTDKRPFKPMKSPVNKLDTSWEQAGDWYDKQVGEKGLYYHQKIIIPKALKILRLHREEDYKLLDLGCGQGVFSRHIPDNGHYMGYDSSDSLIGRAKAHARELKNCKFTVGDITQKIDFPEKDFTHCLLMLALQDCGQPEQVFANAYSALKDKGKLLIVLNHPCFRIPKQSEWRTSRDKKLQSRLIHSYFSPREETLRVNPSQGKSSPTTHWHHFSLSYYSKALRKAGFLVREIYEWCSDKTSTGKYAKMENKARQEIPLFLAIEALKYDEASAD